jgi:pimeloyl-ACP methyl ester carboxylesterase
MPLETPITVQSLDGLHLAATLVRPDGAPRHAALLVHGGGVTREEGGFFTRVAAGLAEVGVASLRLDLPGHGESEGRQEDLSLSGVLNTIRSGLDHLRTAVEAPSVSLIAASFSGGVAAYYTAKCPDDVHRLVLFNPLMDYKQRFVDEKQAWSDDYISEKAGRQLLDQGYVGHSPTFKLGRPILNEVFWLHPRHELRTIVAPTLIVHGTEDTFVPVESSRQAAKQLTCEHRLFELDGAQHGFAVHDDPSYSNPQSQAWQAEVIEAVQKWLTSGL